MEERQATGPSLRRIGSKSSPLLAPISIITELVKNKFLIQNLIRREVRGQYRNSSLGYFWTVLEPALLAVVYWFLFIMLSGNPDRMYAAWVVIGVVVWGCFAKALNAATNSLSGNVRIIHLVYFPRSIFPVASVGANIAISLMSCVIVLPIIIIYDLPITIHLIWVPVGIFMAGAMAFGLGLVMAPLNCIQGDVRHIVRFLTRAGFFVSPVMWTAEMAMQRGKWGEWALWNPMVTPITMVRHGIEGKMVDLPLEIILTSIASIGLLYLIGSYVFSRYERVAVKYL
jgi:ABC-2 type transport system permease protein